MWTLPHISALHLDKILNTTIKRLELTKDISFRQKLNRVHPWKLETGRSKNWMFDLLAQDKSNTCTVTVDENFSFTFLAYGSKE